MSLLRRGETKGLFDLGQALVKAFLGSGDSKGSPEREKEWRVAAALSLGEVWSNFGNQVRPSHPDSEHLMTF